MKVLCQIEIEIWGGRRVEELEFTNLPIPRMLFPKFGGGEPRIWIARCVDYFTLYRVPEPAWVVSASLNMEGNAKRWFQIFKIQHGLGSWEEFCGAVIQKFGAQEYSQAMQSLLNLRQVGCVEEYQKSFDEARYTTLVHNHTLDETLYVSQFVKGLKPELQGPVQSHVPESVERAAFLAQVQQGILDKQRQRSLKTVNQGRLGGQPAKTDHKGTSVVPEMSKERLVKEFRRQNGLCYTCGEKFEPGHQTRCPKKVQMQLNALSKEDLEMTLIEEVLTHIEQEEKQEEETYLLSLNAISGTTNEECMGVRALLQNQIMLILVDSGSSSSFVSSRFVERVGLKVVPCVSARVRVANGNILRSNTMVKAMEWWANGHTYVSNMRVLELGAYDAILGYDWLKGHSPMHCDWEKKVISFVDRGVWVQLRGNVDQTEAVVEVSTAQVERWLKGNDIWAFALLEQVTEGDRQEISGDLQGLLEEFRDLFDTPTELPPSRPFDHHIPLVPGAIPVNSRPYRYSPHHKTEIEKQVIELLKAGLITPSVSPFASPVLLVQKKDGSWRFCVDYRKLNDMTIKNRFPMPVVEEILDELSGTHFSLVWI